MKQDWKKVLMKEILLINLRHATNILSFHIFNLQHYGDHFSSVTFINAMTKYRSSYRFEVSWSCL